MDFIIPGDVRKKLEKLSMIGEYKPTQRVMVRCLDTNNEWVVIDDIVEISGNRSVGVADTMYITLDNRNGKYSPESKNHNSPWLHVLTPNCEINVELGYGNNLTQYFRGFISDVEMSSFPQILRMTCLSKYKLALDNSILVDKGGKLVSTIIYRDEYLEDVFIDLALKAGWLPSEIIIEGDINSRTGIKMSEIEFSRETYADAFSFLSELSQFEIICDEHGQVKFLYPTISQPAIVNLPIILDERVILNVDNIIENSEEVLSEDKQITYKRNVDYKIEFDRDLEKIVISRVEGGSIPNGSTVLLSYVFPAWIFREGYDLIGTRYKLSDENAYKAVVVSGEKQSLVVIDGKEELKREVIEGYADYKQLGLNYYGDTINKLYKMPSKILFIDTQIANTQEQCDILAERALRMCNKRYRNTWQSAVAIPWLQVGDTIQILEESTTISEAYRITSMDISYTRAGFVMDLEAYHVGAFKALNPNLARGLSLDERIQRVSKKQ